MMSPQIEHDTTASVLSVSETVNVDEKRLSIPLLVHSRVASQQQPITVGLPLPRGVVMGQPNVCLKDQQGNVIVSQSRCLNRWSDGSIKWLLVDAMASNLPAGQTEWDVCLMQGPSKKTADRSLSVYEKGDVIVVDTGYARFEIDRTIFRPFLGVEIDGRQVATSHDSDTLLTDHKGHARHLLIDDVAMDTSGPQRATVTLSGKIPHGRGLRFVARLCFFAGTGLVRVRLALHNSNRARHRGGLWDLGDAGSVLFRDLSMKVGLAADKGSKTRWKCEPDQPLQEQEDVGSV